MNNIAEIKLTFNIPYDINKNNIFISKEVVAKAIENANWFQMPISIDYGRNGIYQMSKAIGYIHEAPQEIVWDDENHAVKITVNGKLYNSTINVGIIYDGTNDDLEILGIDLNK